MIAQLRGTLVDMGANWAVIDVGGVGFKVWCTPGVVAGLRPGGEATLVTSLVVREDSLTLYGFASTAEREAFELVQQTSGIGPKTALATLAVFTPGQLAQAVRQEDIAALTRVPGIGRKGAQKLLIELHDKVAVLVDASAPEEVSPSPGTALWREQVSQGLQGLGWSVRDAESACEQIAPLAEDNPDIALGSLMRAALRSLAKA